ncbi:hypothetical protein SNE40_004618 [Patella caerulea]|uniref:Ethylmalonyl-CoA decarboxylase n=1 Tax=Patella caerulea TaxID=87958 RepID=A0AAN8K3A8_PATCE
MAAFVKSSCSWIPRFISYRGLSSLNSNLRDTKDLLIKYNGGTVDLVKDTTTGIATISLNNPGKKNALTGKMMVELADNISELETWGGGKGLILTGTEGSFCSGGDLDFVKKVLTPELGFQMSCFMHDTLSRLHQLPMISVALIQGGAFGGGAELTTACDFRTMTESARIGFVNIKMGVITGFSGGTRLTRILGQRKALDILCSGRSLDCNDAKTIGLVDLVIPDMDSLDKTKSWLIKNYCTWDTEIIRRVKQVTLAAAEMDIETSLARERILFSQLWGGPAQKAAVSKNLKHN